MEIENINRKTKKETEERDQKAEEIQRITISKMVGEALSNLVERVNDGFDGGKVNRSQVANWILLQSTEMVTDVQIKEIRAEHLDEFAFLEALMRKAKKSGKMPTELRSYVSRQLGLDDAPKKRKKVLPCNTINDDITNGDE